MVTALSLPLIDRVGAAWAFVGAAVLTLLTVFLGIGMRRRSLDVFQSDAWPAVTRR